MKAYKDLEGTQLAKDGDRVAMITSEHSGWYCPDVARRPIMKNGAPCFEGSHDQDGETMTRPTT